jgi:hypothetical protein
MRRLTLLEKLYPQFQPKSAFDVRAVVLANKNTPESTAPQIIVSLVPAYSE